MSVDVKPGDQLEFVGMRKSPQEKAKVLGEKNRKNTMTTETALEQANKDLQALLLRISILNQHIGSQKNDKSAKLIKSYEAKTSYMENRLFQLSKGY